MDETITLIVTYIAISVPFIAIGFITERWFEESGYAPMRRRSLTIVVLFIVFLKQVKLPELSWCIYSPVTLVWMTIGLHWLDLYKTQKEGRFWWRSD